MVILTLLTTIPNYSSITILSDNQAAIQAINQSLKISLILGLHKYKNWLLLDKIVEICQNQKITLTLEKVLAHSGIIGNKIADCLAKIDYLSGMRSGEKTIILKTTNNHHNRISAKWNNINIDIPIKNLCQTFFKAKRLAQWRLLNRTRNWLDKLSIDSID